MSKNRQVTVKNFNEVIDIIKTKYTEEKEPECKKFWVESLNDMLDNMAGEDFFGTECQTDPRGDGRLD